MSAVRDPGDGGVVDVGIAINADDQKRIQHTALLGPSHKTACSFQKKKKYYWNNTCEYTRNMLVTLTIPENFGILGINEIIGFRRPATASGVSLKPPTKTMQQQ